MAVLFGQIFKGVDVSRLARVANSKSALEEHSARDSAKDAADGIGRKHRLLERFQALLNKQMQLPVGKEAPCLNTLPVIRLVRR